MVDAFSYYNDKILNMNTKKQITEKRKEYESKLN